MTTPRFDRLIDENVRGVGSEALKVLNLLADSQGNTQQDNQKLVNFVRGFRKIWIELNKDEKLKIGLM